jgi:hypothetical protein
MKSISRWVLVLGSALGVLEVPAEAQVYNLHLVTDNQPDYTDMKSFVDSSTGTWRTPEEKAIAVWRWGRRSRRQLSCSREGTRYIFDPILNYNSYGALNCIQTTHGTDVQSTEQQPLSIRTRLTTGETNHV